MTMVLKGLLLAMALLVLAALGWAVLSPADDGVSVFPGRAAAEALAQAGALKSLVQIRYQHGGICPRNGESGLMAAEAYSGTFVAGVTVQPMAGGCEIVATLRGPQAAVWSAEDMAAAGHSLRLQLSGQPLAWHWRCVGDMPARYLPEACSSTEN